MSDRSAPIYYDPFDVELDRTVHDVWHRMREEQPVYWNERYEFFALSRFDDVWDAYHDTTTFSSTHGVMLYHPNPQDYWRWTHTGLEKLFRDNGEWASVDVEPGAGTAASLALLIGNFLHLLAKRAGAPWIARPFVALLNGAAGTLDGRVAALRDKQPGALFANLHVTAVKA